MISIDLVSDTVSRPDDRMRMAMASAELGDEQREGDPTTNLLCTRVAEMLGKEAALFLPSGTLCNLVAASVWCRPGEAIVADASSHVIGSELGGVSAVSGALMLSIAGTRGQFGWEEVDRTIASLVGTRAPQARLLWVEQTHNRGGGSVWAPDTLRALTDAARGKGLLCHMDGARLLNAAVASGTTPDVHASGFDSVWIDLSKGLGCPAGAVLAGSAEFIRRADVWKRRLGGALRQSGVLAAAGLYALQGYEDRLARDHANARALAQGLASILGLEILHEPVETNLLFVSTKSSGMTAVEVQAALRDAGIRVGVEGQTVLRMVTHWDIDAADVDRVLDVMSDILAQNYKSCDQS